MIVPALMREKTGRATRVHIGAIGTRLEDEMEVFERYQSDVRYIRCHSDPVYNYW